MALSQSILKLNIVEDRDASVPVYTFTDITDYTGNGVALGDVKTAIKIEVNGTSIYDNIANIATTPDIDGSSAGQSNEDILRSRTTTAPIQLPTNSDGSFTEGEIKVTYAVTENAGVTLFTNVVTIDNDFDLPTGKLTSSLDLTPTHPMITVNDVTTYVVQSVTPTLSRTLSLYYPSSTGEVATVTSSTELTSQRFYTGQQEATLSTIGSWDYSGKKITGATDDWTADFFSYTINDTLTASCYINVPTTTSICDIFCCVSEFNDRVNAATGDAKRMLIQKQGQIGFYLNMISNAYSCSLTTDVSEWVETIKKLTGCKGDCSCDDGSPTLIIPVTGSSVSVGNVITFTTTSGQTEIQNNNLINKVYTSTQNDFIVYLDNVPDNISFVSSTGTVTFSTGMPSGVAGKILILR